MVIITIGVISCVSGAKQGLKRKFDTREEAAEKVEKYIFELMKMGWMPAYVLLDGKQCMRKLTNDCYEIEI